MRRRIRSELAQAREESDGELDDGSLADIIARAVAAVLGWHLEAPEHARNATLSSRSWRPAGGPRGGGAQYERRERDFERGPRDFDRRPREYDDRPPRDFDERRPPRDFEERRPPPDFEEREDRPYRPRGGGGFKPRSGGGGFKPRSGGGGFKPRSGGGGFKSRRPR